MILIAESKTMASAQSAVSADEFREFRPLFDGIANSIMDSLRSRTPEQLTQEVGISMKLAASLQSMIYEFPNNSRLGIPRLHARPSRPSPPLPPILHHRVSKTSSTVHYLTNEIIMKKD